MNDTKVPGPIAPHGGRLVNRVAEGDARAALLEKAKGLPKLRLDARGRADVEMISTGAVSPLEGFLKKADYTRVVEDLRLASGVPISVPVTLGASREEAKAMKEGGDVALVGEEGQIYAVLHLEEIYEPDKAKEAREVYRTEETAHPGVAYLKERGGDVYLGGKVTLLNRAIPREFPESHRDPIEVRRIFEERGWRRVVAFQTRNPVHRAHEHLLRSALEASDGLLLHPLVGETKGDDIPAPVRMRCYEALLASYFPKSRVLLSVLPAAMRYAGPREAIFHAVMRQNYGCTHFIVGRDHAGVGSYYGTYDAQKIFERLSPGELGITPLFFENSFFCTACGGMASVKTCPHDEKTQVSLSGTKVREKLRAGEPLPVEFTRPEVAAILSEAFRAK
jgi:ATP sulfurylase